MLYNKSLFKEVDEFSKKLYFEVIDLILKIDQTPNDERKKLPGFECHTICRAFAGVISDLICVDGSFIGVKQLDPEGDKYKLQSRICHHSWLVTPKGLIIDPWPVGVISLNAILVTNSGEYSPYGSGSYIEDSDITDLVTNRSLKWRSTRLKNFFKEVQNSHT